MIIIIDNYDSFTYNLYQYIGAINQDIKVYRNDKVTVKEVLSQKVDHIIISPGPKFPKDAGITIDLIKEAAPTIPILGVCLGHQAIGEAFGAQIIHAPSIKHGKVDEAILDTTNPLFKNLEQKILVGRYHSLIIDENSLPDDFKISAKTNDGIIMGIAHKKYKTYGIQFHPESVLTPKGMDIIKNFLNIKI